MDLVEKEGDSGLLLLGGAPELQKELDQVICQPLLLELPDVYR